MIRLGTVGTSRICDWFLSGCEYCGRYKLSAVYSRDAGRGREFAEAHGCKTVFTSLYEMAESDLIDAVYIASPNRFHAEQSRIFLENGKHVLCEKPIVVNADEYIELKKTADRNGLIYLEAMMPRHIPKNREIKEAVRQIGDIVLARIDYCQRSSRLETLERGEQVNIFDMSLHAGTLMDIGIYCVYGAVDLLGKPRSISAEKRLLPCGADGSGHAVFKYDGFDALLTYSKTADGALGSEIIGSRGTLKLRFISQYAGVSLVKDGEEKQITGFPSRAELMSGEADHFADYIIDPAGTREKYDADSELALDVHRCMDEIKKSAGLVYPDKKGEQL